MARTRRSYLRLAAGLPAVAAATPPPVGAGGAGYDVVAVPRDEPTVQAGVNAAGPGDLVLVSPGTYEEAVEIQTPGLTLRGLDRNEVVLDGGLSLADAVTVHADGVAVENLTARRYEGNAFYWSGVEGFRGSYLTAHNDGNYGLYAYECRDGRFERSYASGHPDAGVYLGRSLSFEAVVTGVTAEYNAWGFSGTSAGGDLVVRDSTWRHNLAGIVPNTLDTYDPPQRGMRIVDNEVCANDGRRAPTKRFTYPAQGCGVLVWGGNDDLVAGNRVRDHGRFGVVLARNVDVPDGNLVRDNDVAGSGLADLALGRPAGSGNRFVDNSFETALPPGLGGRAAGGSRRVTESFAALREAAARGEYDAGDWRRAPEPGDRPSMPDPQSPPVPARRDASVVPSG